jgi:hypothetical protein
LRDTDADICRRHENALLKVPECNLSTSSEAAVKLLQLADIIFVYAALKI